MKVIVPIKEHPTFIECHIYDKDMLGESTFLYREIYNKELMNMDTYKKLLRCDQTLEYLERQLELLTLIDGDKELIKIVQTTIDKLTKDVVIL